MLRPRSETTLPATQAPALLSELPTWNPLTPVEELPQKLQQLRQARQQLNKMLADAEGQVLHFLRKGPLAERQKVVKELIERFYPLGALAATHTDKLDKNLVDENVALALSGASVAHWPGFKFAWSHNSGNKFFTHKQLNKLISELDWTELAGNGQIDWDEALLNQHWHRSATFFDVLSKNNGLRWTSSLLRNSAPDWEYSTEGLLGNRGLPWEDETLPELLRELHAIQYEAINEEEIDEDADAEYLAQAKQAAKEMKAREWERRSADRHQIWTVDYLRQCANQLDWVELSANSALPFSFALLTEFEGYWEWGSLTDNHGIYEKVLAPLLSDTIVDEFLTLYKN